MSASNPQKGVPKVMWTTRQLEIVRKLYAETPNAQLAKLTGHSVKSVVAVARRMGIRKSYARLQAMGRENIKLRKGWVTR